VRKAADLDAIWRAAGFPPGSESRACIQRGNSGTWESHTLPCGENKVTGNPVRRRNSRQPGEVFAPGNESEKRHKEKRDKAGYQARTGNTERT